MLWREDGAGDHHEGDDDEAKEDVEDALEEARVEAASPAGVVDGGELAEVAEGRALDGGVDEVEGDVAGCAHLRGGVHEGGEVGLGGVRGRDVDVGGERAGEIARRAVDCGAADVAGDAGCGGGGGRAGRGRGGVEGEPARDLEGLADGEAVAELRELALLGDHEDGGTDAAAREHAARDALEGLAGEEHDQGGDGHEVGHREARGHGLGVHDEGEERHAEHEHGDVGDDHAELLDGAAAHEAAVDVEGVVEEGDQQDEREVDDAVGADLCGGDAGLGEADLDGSPEGRQDADDVHRPEGEPSEGSASVHWLPVAGG